MSRLKSIYAVAIILYVAMLQIDTAFAEPVMKFEAASHDFGVVEQGTSHKHIFKFKNVGDSDLNILEVKPSCGCTAALLSSEVVPPGGEGELEVTFNSGRFKGKIRKYINIATNEKFSNREIKGPVKVRKLHKLEIDADVIYDEATRKKLMDAREKAMRESKKKKND